MRAGEAAPRSLQQPILLRLEQIDREPLGVEQLGDPLDRGLQCVGERELRDRLTDDGNQRPAALQLDRLPARLLARTQCVGCSCRKHRQSVEHLVRRDDGRLEPELQHAEGRLAEL